MADEVIYGVKLLDDIHNYFPDLLYNNRRFNTVQGVLSYITSTTQLRFNLFRHGQNQYVDYSDMPPLVTAVPVVTAVPNSVPVVTTVTAVPTSAQQVAPSSVRPPSLFNYSYPY